MKKDNTTWCFPILPIFAGIFDALVGSSLNWQSIAMKIAQALSALCILLMCRECLWRRRANLWICPVMILMICSLRVVMGKAWIIVGEVRFGLYRVVYVILLLMTCEMLCRSRRHASVMKPAVKIHNGRILYPWAISGSYELISLSSAAMGTGLLWFLDAPLSLCVILFIQTLSMALGLLPSGRKNGFCCRIITVLICLFFLTWETVRHSQVVWARVSFWKRDITAAKHLVMMVPFCGDGMHAWSGRNAFRTSRVLEKTAVMYGWEGILLCLVFCLMFIIGMRWFVKKRRDRQWNLLAEAAILYFILQTIGAIAVFLGLMPDLDFMLPFFYGGWTIPIGLTVVVAFPNLFSKGVSR